MRQAVLDRVAAMLPAGRGPDCVLVGVDGVDGAGKTTFADELAAAVRAAGRTVVRIAVDDFHQVRALRYRRGRDSPDGFWLDSFDYGRLHEDVLVPLGPGGSRRYRHAAHDLRTDQVLFPPPRSAPAGAVVIVDGLFLHRAELAAVWDFSILLDVPFEVSAMRMSVRDGTPADPAHPRLRRYVAAQRRYFAECSPRARATVVIDNSDLADPRIVR